VERSKRLWPILDYVFIGLLCLYAFAGMIRVPFHGDESTLIYMSRDYETIFAEGDVDAVRFLPVAPPRYWHGFEQFQRILTAGDRAGPPVYRADRRRSQRTLGLGFLPAYG